MRVCIWIGTTSFLIEGGTIRFKCIKETFNIPPYDANNEVLWRYPLNYDLNVMIIC